MLAQLRQTSKESIQALLLGFSAPEKSMSALKQEVASLRNQL